MPVDRPQPPSNLRTALILASIALVFFVGIMLKYWISR
jgi:hypothetical protein